MRVACGMWHVACGMWQVAGGVWHVARCTPCCMLHLAGCIVVEQTSARRVMSACSSMLTSWPKRLPQPAGVFHFTTSSRTYRLSAFDGGCSLSAIAEHAAGECRCNRRRAEQAAPTECYI